MQVSGDITVEANETVTLTLSSGAIVGGTSGAIAGALARAGYSKDESEFYGPAVERGGVLVAVETEDVASANEVGEILTQHGGRTYRR